jgi:hypothetical protein
MHRSGLNCRKRATADIEQCRHISHNKTGRVDKCLLYESDEMKCEFCVCSRIIAETLGQSRLETYSILITLSPAVAFYKTLPVCFTCHSKREPNLNSI